MQLKLVSLSLGILQFFPIHLFLWLCEYFPCAFLWGALMKGVFKDYEIMVFIFHLLFFVSLFYYIFYTIMFECMRAF